MTAFTPAQLLDATQGRWLTKSAGGRAVNTDTRTVTDGDIFIALQGDNHDAHDYLDDAAQKGAAVLIVSDEQKAQSAIANPKSAVLLVPDTLDALQNLARFHRHRLHETGVTVIAVTGSNGKTTTRHLIHTVLSGHPTRGRGTQSPKSFNNHIGLPLTLLGAALDDHFVVAEIGTNHPGEIAHLSDIARPDAAVITMIGTAHIGMFGSREAIAVEKGAVLRYVHNHGLAVIPDEPLLCDLPDHLATVRIGRDIRCTQHDAPRLGEPTRFAATFDDGSSHDFTLPLRGEHNIANALAAIAVGRWCEMECATIAAALAGATPVDMRGQIEKRGGVTIINDAYNANPDSMRAAINLLAATPTQGRRIAILGDMFELGDAAEAAHRDLGRQLAALSDKIDRVMFVGELSAPAAEAMPADRVTAHRQWSDDLPQVVADMLRPGDLVLVKASRGMALERLLEGLAP